MPLDKNNPYGKYLKVDLKHEDYNRFIWSHGIRVTHEKTSICPHVFDKQSGHQDITCDVCDNGRLHFDPKELWILFYQKKMEEMFQVQGVWELGDILVTFPGLYEDGEVVRVDYYDRLTLLDFSERTSDLVKRDSSSDIDEIRYEVVDVEKIRTKTTEYTKDVDYQVTDTNIEWISANRPANGEVYSLAYLYRPVFRVVNFFHESRYYYDSKKSTVRTPVYLPVQAQIRRDYIIESRKGYD